MAIPFGVEIESRNDAVAQAACTNSRFLRSPGRRRARAGGPGDVRLGGDRIVQAVFDDAEHVQRIGIIGCHRERVGVELARGLELRVPLAP